jgi:hypothetical protein
MMLDRWRSNPISFIETVLYDPETKRPFKLLPAELMTQSIKQAIFKPEEFVEVDDPHACVVELSEKRAGDAGRRHPSAPFGRSIPGHPAHQFQCLAD